MQPMNDMRAGNVQAGANARTRALLEAPIVPTIIRLAAPTALVTLVNTGVTLAETAFIGRLGTEPLAGYALVFPLMMLMQMMSTGGIGGGVASAVARALGAGDQARARAVVWHAFAIASAAGLTFTMLVIGFGPLLYRALGGEGAALSFALLYSNILFTGAVLTWLSNTCGVVLRGSGDTHTPGLAMLAASLLQLGLGFVLILHTPLGLAGAAIAMLSGQLLSLTAMAFVIARGGAGFRLGAPMRLHWAPARDILAVGAVAAAMTVLANLTTVLVTALVAPFGTAAIAGYGIGARLEFLQIPIAFGVGAALTTMVGVAVGAGRWERARRAAWIGGSMAAGVSGLVGFTLALWPAPFIAVFTQDPDVAHAATLYFQYAAPAFVFFGLGMALYFASQGAGRMTWPFVAGLFRLSLGAGAGLVAVVLFGAGLEVLFGLVGLGLFCYGAIIAGSIALDSWRPRGAAP